MIRNTEIKNGTIIADDFADDLDASGIGFNAAKLGGQEVGDLGGIAKFSKMDAGIELSPAHYANGDDGNLDFPTSGSGHETNPVSFSPIGAGGGDYFLRLGDRYFRAEGRLVGPNRVNEAAIDGSTYAQIWFRGAGNPFNDFPSADYNGRQRTYFPKSGVNELGGYIEYFYDYNAWYTAFYGETSTNQAACPHITIDGSVYKGTVLDYANLVVSNNGDIGPAGGGPSSLSSYKYWVTHWEHNLSHFISPYEIHVKCYEKRGTDYYEIIPSNIIIHTNYDIEIILPYKMDLYICIY